MNLINFLKIYSSIPNNFIEDFFGMYDIKNKHSFSISLDIIAKWLDTRKGKLKETLLATYTKNTDYIIQKSTLKSVGKPKEIILLTPKCFKLLCMLSKTKKAVEVREFYLSLEDVLDQYKDYIIDGLKEKINKLENNQKPKINQQSGIIYIIQTSDGIGLYKLGRTKNLNNRLKSYNADKIDDIEPLFIYETKDIEEVEKCVKAFCKQYQYRKYKEVFQIDLNLLKQFIVECGNIKKNVHLKYQKHKLNNLKGGNNMFMCIYTN